jgi:hypothetical protein
MLAAVDLPVAEEVVAAITDPGIPQSPGTPFSEWPVIANASFATTHVALTFYVSGKRKRWEIQQRRKEEGTTFTWPKGRKPARKLMRRGSGNGHAHVLQFGTGAPLFLGTRITPHYFTQFFHP